jgi:hypothetical protein
MTPIFYTFITCSHIEILVHFNRTSGDCTCAGILGALSDDSELFSLYALSLGIRWRRHQNGMRPPGRIRSYPCAFPVRPFQSS